MLLMRNEPLRVSSSCALKNLALLLCVTSGTARLPPAPLIAGLPVRFPGGAEPRKTGHCQLCGKTCRRACRKRECFQGFFCCKTSCAITTFYPYTTICSAPRGHFE